MLNDSNKTRTAKTKQKLRSPQCLKKLAFEKIKAFPKNILVSVLCEDRWEGEVKNWRNSAPLQYIKTSEDGAEIEMNWFSKPHTDKHGKVRFHFTDCSHILTCLRAKICTTGIAGLRKQAWVDASISEDTNLNIGIVVECIDKQSVPFAKRMFGDDVETYMFNKNYVEEAKFVNLIRRWYEAEDNAGISAADRSIRRLNLRQYLLERSHGCFSSFHTKLSTSRGFQS